MTDILQSKLKQLNQEEIEIFMRDGCLVVHDVFPKEIAGKVIPLICNELKINIHDPATWPKHLVTLQKILQRKENKLQLPSDWLKFTPLMILKKSLETNLVSDVYTQRYYEVINDLCGKGKWNMSKYLGHWPILFPFFNGYPWQPLEGGWHLDGDFEYMSLTSSHMGLILMHLFTDIDPGGGGTAIRLGSHQYTSRILAEAGPDGLDREELIKRVIAATQHLPVKELTGNNGDLLIMHPWVIHSSSLNTSDQFRIAANKHISLHTPMNFKRNKLSDYSIVELAVIDSVVKYGNTSLSKNIKTNKTYEESSQPPKQQSLRKVLKRMNHLRYINAKDLVRISVLRSNRYWPFSKLNKIPYELALKAFVNHCSEYPEIKSVYLRHQLIEGNWTPGLSDIDLTIIIKKDLSTEEEFNFLNLYWKKFRHLKKIFPMYGEIYIIREADFELWQKLELEGGNISKWKLIEGDLITRNGNGSSKSQFKTEAFNQALSFYLYYFLDLFNRKGFSSRLISFDLYRVKNKIIKCLQQSQNLPEKNNIQLLNLPINSKVELLCNVVKELKESLAKSPTSLLKINTEWQKDSETKSCLLVDDEAIDMNKLSLYQEYIESIYLNYNKKIFIVLKNGLPPQTFNDCLRAITETFSAEKELPAIFNINLFKYFLRQYKPFEYGHFISYRTLAFGSDILPGIAPSEKSALVNFLVKDAAEILKFPYSQKFFSSSGKWNSSMEIKHLWNTGLMILNYIEHNSISPWYQDVLDESYEAYPEYVKRFNALEKLSANVRDSSLDMKWFILFKQLADDIHKKVNTNNIFEQTINETSTPAENNLE